MTAQRDHAKLTSWFISTIMLDAHIEDRTESQTTFVFDCITITDVSPGQRVRGDDQLM
jgi:hypothetical protein